MNADPQNKSSHASEAVHEQVWRERIRHQKESGLSRKEYCLKHQLNYNQFGYWARKYCEKAASSKLVPLHLNSPTKIAPETVCTLALRNGHELKIHDKTLLPLLLSLWG